MNSTSDNWTEGHGQTPAADRTPRQTLPSAFNRNSLVSRGDRPTKVFRSVVLLLVCAGVLLVFIALLGDWRREHNIRTRLDEHAAIYAARLGEGSTLPLNLELDVPRDPKSRLIEAWISPADAALLRGRPDPVLAAWTVPIVRVLGTDGRGVIMFEGGRFESKWLTLEAFEKTLAEQSRAVSTLRGADPE